MPTLDFEGKHAVRSQHLIIPIRPLDVDSKKSLTDGGGGVDENLIIHSDNLDALKALCCHYAGKVNCIYIDPPYNTGNESWIYNDNVNSPRHREWLRDKSPVDGEDLERHDKWLSMMWPRLALLRDLLSEKGVIFISIDDNEQHHLRIMMDEIFGEENLIANIIWQHRHGRSNNAKLFSNQREHIVTYRKSKEVEQIRVKRPEGLNSTYKNPDNDPRGKWIASAYVNPATKRERPNLVYPIKNPHTGEMVNHPTHAWKYSEKKHAEHVKQNMLWWGIQGKYKYPRLKNFLSDSKQKGIVPVDLILPESGGTTDEGTRQLQDIFRDTALDFNNPKPTKLIKHLINISEGCLQNGKDTLILDAFAGSGTTAHAVLDLNKEDGGSRNFILVECEDYADKITAERVRRVIRGIPGANDDNLKTGLGGSFTYCTLGEKISVERMLSGKRLPSYEHLARHLYYTATGQPLDRILPKRNNDGLFCETRSHLYYLVYEPRLSFLRSKESALNDVRARRISKRAKLKAKTAVVYATHTLFSERALHDMNIKYFSLLKLD